VAHTCNPNYSRSRDHVEHGLKPAQANREPISKNPLQKKTGGVALSSNPSTGKKIVF
jgi:hypothetical protein